MQHPRGGWCLSYRWTRLVAVWKGFSRRVLQPAQLRDVSLRYAGEIAEVRGFLVKAGCAVETPQALGEVAERVSRERAFHRDLMSHVWVVLDRCAGISYPDLLGVLAVAAAGPGFAAAAEEEDAHRLLRFLMEARHAMDGPGAGAEVAPERLPERRRGMLPWVLAVVCLLIVAAVGVGLKVRRSGAVAGVSPLRASRSGRDDGMKRRDDGLNERGGVEGGGNTGVSPLRASRSGRDDGMNGRDDGLNGRGGVEVASAPVASVGLPAVAAPAAMEARPAAVASAGAAVAARPASAAAGAPVARAGRGPAPVQLGQTPVVKNRVWPEPSLARPEVKAAEDEIPSSRVPVLHRRHPAEAATAAESGTNVAVAEVPAAVAAARGNAGGGNSGSGGGSAGTAVVGTVHGTSLGVMASNLIYNPMPAYPAAASAEHVQGEVRVSADVDRQGKVGSVRVISGPLLLRDAAIEAVGRWRYRPYQGLGGPVPMAAIEVLDFELP